MEQRSQWNFESNEAGWVWTTSPPDRPKESSSQAFKTLKACVDDAVTHGYVAWKAEDERRRDLMLGVTKALARDAAGD